MAVQSTRMAPSPKLDEFIERARSTGAADQTIVGILTSRGWSEKEIYESLAAHYEKQTGVEIPHRESSATPAKDAFFYLLAFSTLATWTICLGSLAFDLIDRYLQDVLFPSDIYSTYNASGSLACVLVSYPIYLLLTRAIIKQVRAHPEKLNSPVRKWLTYIALVFAAGVFIGDLITTLSYYLRGEITSRFLLKALVVLIISGAVFFYYFWDLRKSPDSLTPTRPSIDTWAALLATVGVLALVIWGFTSLGAPSSQRTLRGDRKRVQDLYQLSTQIDLYWKAKNKLPGTLDEVESAAPFTADPMTHAPYEYHPKDGSHYDLCATFYLANKMQLHPSPRGAATGMWLHPAGHYCFSFEAAIAVENPYSYYPE